MGRKKKCECKKGLPGWMATFSDMVTLLLTFFVMLMAMANFDDTEKVDAVITSIQTDFGMVSFFNKSTGIGKEPSFPSISAQRETQHTINAKLREAFSKHLSDHMIKMTEQPQEVRLTIDDRVFFSPGGTAVNPAAFALLTDVAAAVAGTDIQVAVEGHTDDSGDERVNWVLSAERAAAVVAILMRRGIEGEKLSAVGRGQFAPGTAISDDPGWSRRIEIIIRGDDVDARDAADSLLRRRNGDGAR